jgi:hypothetical protein
MALLSPYSQKTYERSSAILVGSLCCRDEGEMVDSGHAATIAILDGRSVHHVLNRAAVGRTRIFRTKRGFEAFWACFHASPPAYRRPRPRKSSRPTPLGSTGTSSMSTMRYFTREWYNHLQQVSQCDYNEADLQTVTDQTWRQASDPYTQHLGMIRDKLPDTVVDLSEPFRYHDARIHKVHIERDSIALVLWTDLRKSKYTVEITARFEGTTHSLGLADAEGRVILYHEISITEQAQFAFSALLDEGEIMVEFMTVAISSQPLQTL